jgi:DNA-binding GntR family transcriptional regulator
MRIEELAALYGVSTMPIREALVRLADEGLLIALPRRGFRVAEMSAQGIEDVFGVHAYVSSVLAARAASVMQVKDIANLKRIQANLGELVKMKRGGDATFAKAEELNHEFHRVINKAEPESTLLHWFLRATLHYVPRRFFWIPGWLEASAEEHPLIIQALEDHDSETAAKLMSAHVLRGARIVRAYRSSSSGHPERARTASSHLQRGRRAHQGTDPRKDGTSRRFL